MSSDSVCSLYAAVRREIEFFVESHLLVRQKSIKFQERLIDAEGTVVCVTVVLDEFSFFNTLHFSHVAAFDACTPVFSSRICPS
jgi:hypothetical protein